MGCNHLGAKYCFQRTYVRCGASSTYRLRLDHDELVWSREARLDVTLCCETEELSISGCRLHRRRVGEYLLEGIQDVASVCQATGTLGNRRSAALGIFVVGAAVELAAVFLFADAAPLFEEEWDMRFAALVADGDDPIFLHGTGAGAALSADDGPVYVREIE